MDRSIVPTLVEAFGVAKAAEKILQRQKDKLDQDEEQHFLDHWNELADRVLFVWLMRKAPEGLAARPPLVPRLVEWLLAQAAKDRLFAMELSGWVASVSDEWVRDDFATALRGRVPDDTWERLIPHAAGCKAFRLITKFRAGQQAQRHQFPHGLIAEGPVPCLRDRLFEGRREDSVCREQLRLLIADQTTGNYTLWVLRELDLLKEVVTPELLLGGLPTLFEVDLDWHPYVRFRLDLADDLAEADTFRETVTRRILEASARGVPWGHLWWEIPGDLRDHVGLASVETKQPATWAVASVRRVLSGIARWEKLFSLEYVEHRLDEIKHFHVAAAWRSGDFAHKRAEGWDDFWPKDFNWLNDDPLPDDADEAFEEKFVDFFRRRRFSEVGIVERLSTLPITKDRAARFLAMTIPDGDFYRLQKCDEIAEACGQIDQPVPRPERVSAKALRTYALLVGDESAVAKWFDEAITAKDFSLALRLAEHDEALRTPDRVEALRQLLPRDHLQTLIRTQQDDGWLLTEQEVIQEATTRDFPDDQWMLLGAVPSYLTPVLAAKITNTDNVWLARDLLDRLKKMEVGPKRLTTIAVERVVNKGTAAMSDDVVGRMLASGKLWEGPGRQLVDHVLRERGQAGADWLSGVVYQSKLNNEAIIPTMHAVVADVLIDLAEAALKRGDDAHADRSLRALGCLTAPPRLFRKVRALRGLTASPKVQLLLEANEGWMRKADGETAGVSALWEALAEYMEETTDAEERGAS